MKRILDPGSNCMGIYEVGDTGLLVDACDYYRAFYHAASKARHYILMAGWQFDTDVRLLRGKDSVDVQSDAGLLRFLQSLCQASPELEIYILAWDFSVFFYMEREWFQDIMFNWSAHERIHFRYDSNHALGATHHQKFVIVDGQIAFVGGMDICSSRWDDRRHLERNRERKDLDGNAYQAYHDIQSYHTGPIVKELVRLFQQRWVDSGAEPLLLPTADSRIGRVEKGAIPLAAGRVAVSRTQPRNLQPPQGTIYEIRRLFIDAIMAADKLIYLENQYFSSQAIYWALIGRMAAPDRPRLQIVMMLPDRLPFTEELFLGLPQMRMLRSLQQMAAKTGHALGVYSTACVKDGARKMTFIHSKLLMVDDRFLTVGSANATNRSMGLDTELNVSWEADPAEQPELVRSIREVRASLLAEHAGMRGRNSRRSFEPVEGLVSYLDRLVDDPQTRLCRYSPEPSLENGTWHEVLEPVMRVVDPEKPFVEEFIFESISGYRTSVFAKGILILSQWLAAVF